ncbi:MAG: ribonuclease P protein component [Candidatus Pacebacteria bacterium]|nr:ribonuclease P protein component [Candidatus Paceibacterota bacterium]NUQ56910.1 ribonuclease P protein component [Candidatus Paceibacter sp.]
MLSKENRMDKETIGLVVKSGRSFSSDSFNLKTAPIAGGRSLFAFVVSSKVSKKATERNKLKRRARNIIRKVLSEVKKGAGIIFFFKVSAKDRTYRELKEEMTNSLKKARILQ